jgi:adenine-specific DNA glycosylase
VKEVPIAWLELWVPLLRNKIDSTCRAKFLHQAAQMIVKEFDGAFPTSEADILLLPGVGKNTAGAILAYAFNQPAIYVETNVRTVYIHHFLMMILR